MRALIAKSLSPEPQSSLLKLSSGHKFPRRAAALGVMTCAVMGVAPLSSFVASRAEAAEADARGPIVSIVSPQYSAELKGTVQILVGIEARKNTPQTIELLVDGQSASNGAMALTSFPSANFNWDTTLFTDGPHRLTVTVTDAQGFRGSADVNVYINNKNLRDLTPPALDWLSAKNGDTWRGIVDVKLKVSDNFGVKYLLMTLNPAATPDKKPAAFAWFLNRPPYSASFDSRKAPDGVYTLRALSYDALENEGSAPSVNVTIANNSINPTYVAPKALAQAKPALDTKALAPKNSDSIVLDAPQVTKNLAATPQLSRSTPTDHAPTGALVVPAEATSATRAERDATASVPSGGRLNSNDLLAAAPRPLAAPLQPQMTTATTQNSVVSRPGISTETAPRAQGTRDLNTSNNAVLPTLQARVLSPEAQAQAEQMRIARAESVRAHGAQLSNGSDARDGSISASSTAVAGAPTRDLSGKALLPSTDQRVLMARAEAGPNAKGNASVLVPLAPSRLTTVNEGKVAVHTPSFPSPDLSNDSAQRSSSPLLAAVPAPSILKNVTKAAITVAPLPFGSPGSLPTFHITQKGETLAAISRQYKLPVDVIAKHNKMVPSAVLALGQKVSLPQTLAISYEGKPVTGDVAAMMVGSTGVTPFRFLFEKQGGKLEWDGKNHRVTARNATHQVTLKIGDDKAMVNEKEVMMDLAAFLVSGRTMVPLRFFESALQASVEWEPATGRLFVAMAH